MDAPVLDLPFDAEAMLPGLRRWVECESPTFDAAAVGRVMDMAARDLALLGARIETIPGRMGYGQAALRGALQGAVLGLLFGWLFGLFNWIDPVVASFPLAFYGLVFGPVVGALLGLLTHAMTAAAGSSPRSAACRPAATTCWWMRRSPLRPSGSWLNTGLAVPSLSCPSCRSRPLK